MFHSTYVTVSVTTLSFNCVRVCVCVCQIYVDLYLNGVVKYLKNFKEQHGAKKVNVKYFSFTTKNRNVFGYLSSSYFMT